MQVTNAIRSHDTNHIIYIEGNWFANDYTGLTPPWDDNMVYSFHKYWNVNTQNTIQWVLDDMQTSIMFLCGWEKVVKTPMCGSKKQSRFLRIMILLGMVAMEKNRNHCIVIFNHINPNYNAVVEYFKGNTSAPSASCLSGMLEIAEASKIENCQYRKDVIDAMYIAKF